MKKLSVLNYTPSKKLSRFIDGYWSIRNTTMENIDLPIVPDGCMDIIYKEINNTKDIVLVGAMDEAIIVSMAHGDYYFGVRFKPSVLSFLINQRMDKYSNKIISIEEISKDIYNKLNLNEKDEKLKVQKLDVVFEKEFSKVRIDERIISSVELIIQNRGNISVDKIVEKTTLSQRQLERLFLHHLGYSLKKFIGVIRFFNAHKNIVKNGTGNLWEVAYSNGYCDQAHFNKEHKKYTHFSPKDERMSILYNTNK